MKNISTYRRLSIINQIVLFASWWEGMKVWRGSVGNVGGSFQTFLTFLLLFFVKKKMKDTEDYEKQKIVSEFPFDELGIPVLSMVMECESQKINNSK